MKKIKVVLVRPPSFKMPVIIPNLGLGYLAGVLRMKGHSVSILDCAKLRIDHDEFLLRMRELNPDLVGIQAASCDFSSVNRCLERVKRADSSTVTVVGGPHPSGDPDLVFEDFPAADYAFAGEAELGLPKLIERLEGGAAGNGPAGVEGLIYRKPDGEAAVNPRGAIAELDDIPFPAWDLIDPRTYPAASHGTFTRALPTAPIITSRGCPYSCSYCAVHAICGRTIRYRSIDNVIAEIEHLVNKFGVKEIHIEDDNFTLNKPRVMEFCDRIRKKNLDIWWAMPNGVRLDSLDSEMVKTMEGAGCYSFAVGIESGSPRILSAMKRSVTRETMVEKVNLVARETGIRMTGFFIIGYPGEDLSDVLQTIDLALEIPLDRAQFSNFMPLPGTGIYRELLADGVLDRGELKWDQFQDNRVVYSPERLPPRQVRSLMKKASLKFYLRPRILIGLLREIHSLSQVKTVFMRAVDTFR